LSSAPARRGCPRRVAGSSGGGDFSRSERDFH
jgi:hypothetical protein